MCPLCRCLLTVPIWHCIAMYPSVGLGLVSCYPNVLLQILSAATKPPPSTIPAVIGTPTKDKSSNFGPSIISERRPKIINIVNHWIGINWDGGNLNHDFHPPAAPSQLARRGTAGRCGEFMLISADGWETGLRTLYLYWSSSVLNE